MRSLKCSSRWVVMALHTVVALLVMALSRLLYYRYNIDAFDFIPASHLPRIFLGGALLDFAMVGYACLLYYGMMVAGAFLPARLEARRGWRLIRDLAYILPMALLVVANVADTGYFPYILTRATPSIFVEFEGEDVGAMGAGFIVQFWPLTLAYFLLMGLLLVGFFAIRQRGKGEEKERGRLLGTLVTAVLLFVGMRGTLDPDRAPLDESILRPYVHTYRELPIVQNTPYTLTRSSAAHLRPYHFFDEHQLAQHFDPVISTGPVAEGDSLFGCLRGRSVVILTMESLAREYSGHLNRDIPGYEGYTPFLDSLMPHTLYARYGFASGRRSVESMPSIYASVPAFGIPFGDPLLRQSGLFTRGLPTVLREEGYGMKFYHGDRPGAMGFYGFLSGMGVEAQYTSEDFRRDVPEAEQYFMRSWGVFDGPFEQAMAHDMATLERPFGVLFFSLTNHNPFQVPTSYEGRGREGTLPIHRTCQYADDAMRRFFETIQEEPWYEETLFVITGDHTSLSDRPEYDSPTGRSMVPICFYAPGSALRGEISDRVVSHTDIYPTLLYLLGIDRTIVAYGQNILDDRAEHVALNFLYGRYFLFTRELTLSMGSDGEVEIQPPTVPIQADGAAALPDAATQQHYADLLRAIVQDYTARLRPAR